jgi:ABC-type bacteriocin/lantibiotic exporter with double-glycine peptidase domain
MINWKAAGKFTPYFKKYFWYELLFFFLVVAASLASLASPYFLKIIVDEVIPHKNSDLLFRLLVILVIIYLVRIAAQTASDYLFTWISANIVSAIRKDMFVRIVRRPFSYFQDQKVGDLVHTINNEVDKIEGVLTGSLIRLVNNFFMLTGLVIMLSWLNFRLFLVSAIVFPFVLGVTRWLAPLARASFEKVSSMESGLTSFFTERFEHIKLIKTFNAYGYELQKLTVRLLGLMNSRLRNTLYVSANRNLSTFLIALGPLLIFAYGGSQVILHAMSLGTLIAFIQYLNRLYSPAIDLFYLHADILRASVSIEHIAAILKDQEPTDNPSFAARIDPAELTITNLHFGYADQQVLAGCSMTFQPGRCYGIVGASGCGKSTLLALVCRFLSPNSGCIHIGDRDIQHIDQIQWMNHITIVTQDYHIIHDSIIENIVYCNGPIAESELDEVIHAVGLSDVVDKMQSEEHKVIGDRGTTLSGGQCQRISIARAILRKAEILILDEATSALDSESERQILNYLKIRYRDKIMITVSHRVSAIREVDQIFVIDSGRLVESGSHQELIRKNGFYSQLFHQQLHHQSSVAIPASYT